MNGLLGKTDFGSNRKFFEEWGTQNDQQGRYAGTDQTDDTEPHLHGSDRRADIWMRTAFWTEALTYIF